MIDIIHFSMTASPVVNYILDVILTVSVAVIPIKLITFIILKATK
jgi:hypothetical protein